MGELSNHSVSCRVERPGAAFNATVLAATTAIYAPLVSISDPAVNVVRT